jgi:hypothetical protein
MCVRVSEKPYLDGKLDDAVWQKAASADLRPLTPGREALATSVRLAYDGEFLFVAARCRRGNATDKPPPRKAQPRDADLSGHDRVELLIDVDRDYQAYHRFAVDVHGRALDACWGDTSWNPQWFLATGDEDGNWTVEAAIPLSSLSTAAPQAGDAWAVGLMRLVPAVGLMSWAPAASPRGLPAGFGYVIFE